MYESTEGVDIIITSLQKRCRGGRQLNIGRSNDEMMQRAEWIRTIQTPTKEV